MPEFICSHVSKWFQVLLCNTNNSIQPYSFICVVKWFQVLLYNTIIILANPIYLFALSNAFKYCYVTLIILANPIHSFALLNGFMYCYVTLVILANPIHSFALSNGFKYSFVIRIIQFLRSVKQFQVFYLIRIKCQILFIHINKKYMVWTKLFADNLFKRARAPLFAHT